MRIGFPGTGTAGRHLRPEVAGPEHEVPPEPDMMDHDTAELAYRRGAGLGGAVNLNPSVADHSIRLTLFHPVASEADG